jgi:uncharacterized protein (DUF305 family)
MSGRIAATTLTKGTGSMHSRKLVALLAALLTLSFTVAACGGDDDADQGADAEHTDGAFIAEMVPHHEAAIEMAEMAQSSAQRPEIQQLAQEIIAAQDEEISQLEAAHERLFDAPIGEVDHGSLGLSQEDSGMGHDSSALEGAEDFDMEFIDMMIPHHQGAIRMARIQLESGQDEELNSLAQAIIAAQSAEIEEMNQWREQWYGAPSPAGGVPEEGETPSHEEMGH